jgi:hypothetical protein
VDLSTSVLFAVAVLIGVDNVVMAQPRLVANELVFRGLVAVELTVAAGLTVFGLPGFDAVPVARWLLVALMVWHVVRNVVRRPALIADEEDRP